MSLRRRKPYSDLWTETARHMGIRVSGERSPFRPIETKQEARTLARDTSLVLLLVGLVQISLSWLAGVGTSLDALVYMPLALLVYRFASRVAAGLLVAFVLAGSALPLATAALKIDVRIDLIVLAVLLWASLRSFEATLAVHAYAAPTGGRPRSRRTDAPGAVPVDGAAALAAHPAGSSWFFWAGLAFAVAASSTVLPRFAGHLRRAASVAAITGDTQPAAAGGSITARIGNQPVRISGPAAFTDPRREEPEIGKLAERFVPPTMKLLALFVPPSDLEAFRRDRRFAPIRYVMVEAPREENGRTSLPQFLAAKADENEEAARGGMARLIGADAALSRWLEAVHRGAGEVTEVAGMKVRSEGVLEETDRSISLGAITDVSSSSGAGGGTSRVVVTSLVLVRGEVLVVYSYGSYEKPDDVVTVHEIARQTVRNLINDNPA